MAPNPPASGANTRMPGRPLPPNPFALSDAAPAPVMVDAGPAATVATAANRGDAGAHMPIVRVQDAGAAVAAKPAAAPDSAISSVYYDNFDRVDLGPEWNLTSPDWKIQGGRLCARGAKNHPAWLKRKLPVNARIEFDATSNAAEGDLKVEVWGDGQSFAKGVSYNDATSYLAILGGWKNTFHVLARFDEHKPGRPEVKIDPSGNDLHARPVQQGRAYHFKIERTDAKTVRFVVDDIDVLSFTDPEPLKGKDHEHLGFNDWEVPVCFDNLEITPLPGG